MVFVGMLRFLHLHHLVASKLPMSCVASSVCWRMPFFALAPRGCFVASRVLRYF